MADSAGMSIQPAEVADVTRRPAAHWKLILNGQPRCIVIVRLSDPVLVQQRPNICRHMQQRRLADCLFRRHAGSAARDRKPCGQQQSGSN